MEKNKKSLRHKTNVAIISLLVDAAVLIFGASAEGNEFSFKNRLNDGLEKTIFSSIKFDTTYLNMARDNERFFELQTLLNNSSYKMVLYQRQDYYRSFNILVRRPGSDKYTHLLSPITYTDLERLCSKVTINALKIAKEFYNNFTRDDLAFHENGEANLQFNKEMGVIYDPVNNITVTSFVTFSLEKDGLILNVADYNGDGYPEIIEMYTKNKDVFPSYHILAPRDPRNNLERKVIDWVVNNRPFMGNEFLDEFYGVKDNY